MMTLHNTLQTLHVLKEGGRKLLSVLDLLCELKMMQDETGPET